MLFERYGMLADRIEAVQAGPVGGALLQGKRVAKEIHGQTECGHITVSSEKR